MSVEKYYITNLSENGCVEIKDSPKLIQIAVDYLENRIRNKSIYTGILSGFTELDNKTLGFQNSELILIGGRPYIGKTSLILSLILNISLEQNIPCGFFSLQTSAEDISLRLIAQKTKIPLRKIRAGMCKYDEIKEIQNANEALYQAPLYIVDKPRITIFELLNTIKIMVTEHHVKTIFIDYIDLVIPENSKASLNDQRGEIAKALKILSRELNIPIIVVCSISRGANGDLPSFTNTKYLGMIEHHADTIMFLHRCRAKDDSPYVKASIILSKSKNGTDEIPLKFFLQSAKFENDEEPF